MLVGLHEWTRFHFDLSVPAHQTTFMMLGRALAAALGSATIPVTFLIGRRIAGQAAGLIAAALMAGAVVHLATSHFFTADIPLTFFCALALLAMVALVQNGTMGAYVATGLACGAALACKYTAAFLALPFLWAHWMAPTRPALTGAPVASWMSWTSRGLVPPALGVTVFLATNPLVLEYPERFVSDIRTFIVDMNFAENGPIWTAQFADVQLWSYWFSNLLPWGLGPAFALCALLGVGWLVWRGGPMGRTVAVYAVSYYAIAAQTTSPFMRYTVALVPALSVAAAVLCHDLLERRSSNRLGIAAVTVVMATTWLWALAYTNIYRTEDVRLQAARYVSRFVPFESNVLVEPSQNTPPFGSYFEQPQFFHHYVGFGAETMRPDYYFLHTLDVYDHLYDPNVPLDAKRAYIKQRLSLVDYIVMDDTFLEFYEHLHGPEHAPVREYYRELFEGRLGFILNQGVPGQTLTLWHSHRRRGGGDDVCHVRPSRRVHLSTPRFPRLVPFHIRQEVLGRKRAATRTLRAARPQTAGGNRIAGAQIPAGHGPAASADMSPEMRFPAASSGSRSSPFPAAYLSKVTK